MGVPSVDNNFNPPKTCSREVGLAIQCLVQVRTEGGVIGQDRIGHCPYVKVDDYVELIYHPLFTRDQRNFVVTIGITFKIVDLDMCWCLIMMVLCRRVNGPST